MQNHENGRTTERLLSPSSELLRPGAKILYINDSTDNNQNGGLISGVKTTSINLVRALEKLGYEVDVVFPQKIVDSQFGPQKLFVSLPLPNYPGYEIVLDAYPKLREYILQTKPDAIYVATLENPLGLSFALLAALGQISPDGKKLPYVASFTTRHDQLIAGMLNNFFANLGKELALPFIESLKISPALFQGFLRAIYAGADKILVPTQTMVNELSQAGFDQEKMFFWPRGIDSQIYRPLLAEEKNPYLDFPWYQENPLPVVIYFGRVTQEKNLELLLKQPLPNFQLVVIGDGPNLAEYQEKYASNQVHFLGAKYGVELANLVRFANVHAFTSLTDTFGNTVLEAGASGIPTVGFKGVAGPQDIIKPGVSGFLAENETEFIELLSRAIKLDRIHCAHDIATRFSWDEAATQLLTVLKPTAFHQAQ